MAWCILNPIAFLLPFDSAQASKETIGWPREPRIEFWARFWPAFRVRMQQRGV